MTLSLMDEKINDTVDVPKKNKNKPECFDSGITSSLTIREVPLNPLVLEIRNRRK